MNESKKTEHENNLRVNIGTCSVRYISASQIMFRIGSFFTSLIKTNFIISDFLGHYNLELPNDEKNLIGHYFSMNMLVHLL